MYQPRRDAIRKDLLASVDFPGLSRSQRDPPRNSGRRWQETAKRATDIVIAVLLIALFAPVMVLAAVAIRL